jgi:Clp amino terminal domain, pathogenicity island component
MFERFAEKTIKAIMLAQEESRRLGHNFVGTEQLLLGLIDENTDVAAKVLKSMGVNLKDARIEVEKIIGRGSGFVATEIPFTSRAKRALEFSLEEARELGDDYIETKHLLLGLVREKEGVANQVLESFGCNSIDIRRLILDPFKNSFSQVILDNSSVNEIFIDGVVQIICKTIHTKLCIKPGEKIPDLQENIFARMAILQHVNADTVKIKDVIQQIELTVKQYIIITSEELAEIIFDSLAVILDAEASRQKKKKAILWALKSIIDQEGLPNNGKESFQNLYITISNMNSRDFDTAVTSEDSRLKQRIVKVMIYAGGTASGVALSNHKEIIRELEKYVESFSSSNKERAPSNFDTPEKGNSKSSNNHSGDDENLKRGPARPTGSSPSRSENSEKFPANASNKTNNNVPRVNNLEFSENYPLNFPGISNRGGSSGSSGSSGSAGGGGANYFSSDKSSDGIQGSGHILLGNLGAMASGSSSSEVGGGSSSSGSGDCDPSQLGDCSGCDVGDCGGCEPSCDCFIATAVYGDYNASQVVSLRNFRDAKLMPYLVGRLFVNTYYHLSPPIAEKLKTSPHLAKLVRHILDIFVKCLKC